jgi:hypothetical protein
MIPPFDIFLVDSDGQLVRKGTVETLDVARLRVKIFDGFRTGRLRYLQPADKSPCRG